MKLTKWMFGAIAFSLSMATACSDKDTPDYSGGANEPGEPAKGYLAVNINLPQEASTRADEDPTLTNGSKDNVEFADGTAEEYKVNNAWLYIFTTPAGENDEMKATLHSRHQLKKDLFAPTSPGGNQISASSVEASAIDVDNDTDILWALVMINRPNDIHKMIALEDISDDTTQPTTFKDYLETATKISFNQAGTGFFMTNAPLSFKPGGSTNPITVENGYEGSTLVKLGQAKDIIQPSETEAKANPAGCIFVERAVAKVTANLADVIAFKSNDENGPKLQFVTIKDDGSVTYKDFSATVSAKFGLQNISNDSYIIRRVDGFPTNGTFATFGWDFRSNRLPGSARYYRMVGETPMPQLYAPLHEEIVRKYRTYWALDPYYNENADEDLPTIGEDGKFRHTAEGDFLRVKDNSYSTVNPIYAKENTFDVEHMKYGYTTLAVFKVTFNVEGKNLYTLNGDVHNVYTSSKDVTANLYNYIWAQDKFKESVEGAVKDGVTGTIPNIQDFVVINFKTKGEGDKDIAGRILVESITLNQEASNFSNYFDDTSEAKFQANLTTYKLNNLVTRLNNNFSIEKYLGGVSYYQIPIMHFGDLSTPWTPDGTNQTTVTEAYGPMSAERPKDYLGRYGMVRNNWYELTLNSFTGLGSATMPEIDGSLSDDNNKKPNYIGVETHILSWAKRSQGVGF